MRSPLEKSIDPVCSLDRARELGLDVKKVPTCSPKESGVRGCSLWSSCRFHQKRYGGFKGTRPHMVGYFFRPLNGPPKVDICSCVTFVRAMQPLMDEGLMMRQQNKPHPVVRIVAQEGEPVKVKRSPQTVNSKGERVTKHEIQEVAVPKFPDPTALDSYMEYEREIMADFDGGEEDDFPPAREADDELPEQLKGKK